MEQFGRDSLIAAAAFTIYGVVGQVFTRASVLAPSTVINAELFMETMGFPVQLLRTAAATIVAVFVIRFMRSFEVERQSKLAELQADRLREAERRQTMRGELLNRVVQAQEAERQRIARELHDETGQALTAIGLGLRGIAGKAAVDRKDAVDALTHLEELTNHALNELQRLIAGLRPSHLDDLGLAAALRWYAGEIESRSPLAVRVAVNGDERPLPASLSIGLFRVAQEALTNVVKHASANQAEVRLFYELDRVRLEVHDDGVGFDAPGADRPGWGLMGMQERISLMGGEFRLSSARGQGTYVEVSVPAEMETEQEHDRTFAVGG
jgi:signal transduction histidine kinase